MTKMLATLILVLAVSVAAPTTTSDTDFTIPVVDTDHGLYIPDARVDWDMLFALEGFETRFYVPSDLSGPTIGTGVDVGNLGHAAVAAIFTDVVDSEVMAKIKSAVGLRGDAARTWCRSAPVLSKPQALEVSRRMYLRFQKSAFSMYPWLETAPEGVADAVISFYMHFGNVDRLSKALAAADVSAVAASIRGAKIHGFESRRDREADLVLAHTQNPKDVVKIFD